MCQKYFLHIRIAVVIIAVEKSDGGEYCGYSGRESDGRTEL